MSEAVAPVSRWLERTGYVLLFVVSFLLFAYWTFPYDRVAALLVDRVAQSSAGYTLSIGELSPYWLSGVELTDVKLDKRPSADAPADGASAQPIVVDALRARLAVLPLLWGTRSISFDAELPSGELDGKYVDHGDRTQVSGELSGLDVGKLGVLDAVLTVPVKGELTGEFDLTLAKEADKSDGAIDVTLKGLVIGDGKAKQKLGSMGGLTLDPIEVGDVHLVLEVKAGAGVVKELRSDGKDLALGGSGDLRLASPPMRSRLNLLLKARLTEAYRKKSPRTQTMFSFIDSAPDAAAAKTPDGAFQFRLSGTLNALRAVPQGNAKQ
jgi:type II secretion system protein N